MTPENQINKTLEITNKKVKKVWSYSIQDDGQMVLKIVEAVNNESDTQIIEKIIKLSDITDGCEEEIKEYNNKK
jgi:hypothetical protein